jgi:apolipoprotein N-acyltransferase
LQSTGFALSSAVLLILAYPGWEWSFTAFFAFIPLLAAIDREKDFPFRALVTGWLFGTTFFIGTCWWLTFSPITYAGFPLLLTYFLLLCVCIVVGIFPAFFALILSVLLRRLGRYAMLAAPFIWIATEFIRFWVAGNNWNALAYSQAFDIQAVIEYARIGGIYLVGFRVLLFQTIIAFVVVSSGSIPDKPVKPASPKWIIVLVAAFGWLPFVSRSVQEGAREIDAKGGINQRIALLYVAAFFLFLFGFPLLGSFVSRSFFKRDLPRNPHDMGSAMVVAVQPNVPMDGLNLAGYEDLKRKHVAAAEGAIDQGIGQIAGKIIDIQTKVEPKESRTEENKAEWRKKITEGFRDHPKIVIFPESPMNFMYEDDKDFQEWVRAFAVRNNASVLFNAAEPDPANKKYFNSAVMVDAAGNKIAQYDKIYLVPFGETVPAPLQSIIPALVGSFSYGKEYDLLPFGDTKGGVMICFESHFPNLSREYVNEGADILVEMTNDGYLGPTPVLRQHLANAVFRAVETDRPLVRVTNVGISAYINERGDVIEPTSGYTEDTRSWNVGKSTGDKTFYVRFGDWFAWLCSLLTAISLFFALLKRRTTGSVPPAAAGG